ncbi:MAG TPA: GNAT family N-acetyltransferase [Candidatus Angelobacter sp.]|nr:GNAT family N-acetyltransferase [Candidatus Angelobacter sp.]
MMKVRPARIEDADKIAYVHVESWKTTYIGIVPEAYLASLSTEARTDSWRKQLGGETTLIFVVEDEAGIFGFVSGGALRDPIPGYDAELYAIYLRKQKQREGAGRSLVRRLAEALQRKGYQSLIAWVLEKNPSLGFYIRLRGAPVLTKEIQIGGVQLTEIALGWSDIADLQ